MWRRLIWCVQSKGPVGAIAARKGGKILQKRRQRSQDIELLRYNQTLRSFEINNIIADYQK